MRKAKNNYYQDKFNVKQTWNVLIKVVNSTNLKSDIPDQFHCNGKIILGLQDISTDFTILRECWIKLRL